jgi:nucleotide-binding universal stress UspA family protein
VIPPRSILAAVDFSDTSRTALDFAARLAAHTGAALHVLHAEHPLLHEAAHRAGVDLNKESCDELYRAIDSVQPDRQHERHLHVVNGPAVDVIVNIATRESVDLIVVGSHGMSGAERRMFGSTTEGVLRKASVPILVVPDGWTPPRPDRPDLSGLGPVIAAVDFTEPAVAAGAAACELARVLSTSVEVAHVVPCLPVLERWRSHADVAIQQRICAARKQVNSILRGMRATVPLEVRILSGAVAQSLADIAAPAADRHPLLVLGRRVERSGGTPGAIAYRVLSLAPVPVLVHVEP